MSYPPSPYQPPQPDPTPQQPGYTAPPASYNAPGYPAAPQPYPAGGYGYPVANPKAGTTNGFAVASLVFGILSGILLSIIFGVVALNQIPKNQQNGRGMAIAGLILSGIWLVILIALISTGAMTGSAYPSTY